MDLLHFYYRIDYELVSQFLFYCVSLLICVRIVGYVWLVFSLLIASFSLLDHLFDWFSTSWFLYLIVLLFDWSYPYRFLCLVALSLSLDLFLCFGCFSLPVFLFPLDWNWLVCDPVRLRSLDGCVEWGPEILSILLFALDSKYFV